MKLKIIEKINLKKIMNKMSKSEIKTGSTPTFA